MRYNQISPTNVFTVSAPDAMDLYQIAYILMFYMVT